MILDLVTGDPVFEPASTACLQNYLGDGLVISPVTFIELGPSFGGDHAAAETFLQAIQVASSELWSAEDTVLAHQLWHQHQQRRRLGQAAKRPVADILITSFAARFQGIITRNGADFRNMNASLVIVEP
ncbi:MAG: type II toxin-antitoxin system VapC family toxin [Verrucomicrobiota bacterium]